MMNVTDNEIIGAIVFLLPGFLFVYLACKFAKYETKQIKDNEYYLFSMFISILLYAVIYLSRNFSLDGFENFTIDYKIISAQYVCAIIFGILFGFVLKPIIHKNCNFQFGSPWMNLLRDLNQDEAKYVHIYTSDNCEFYGRVRRYSNDCEIYREISIDDPCQIIRDHNYKIVNKICMGEEIFFTENDIKRILLLETSSNESSQ